MGDTKGVGLNPPADEGRQAPGRTSGNEQPQPRAVGSPLPVGGPAALPSGTADPARGYSATPPGRALASQSADTPIEVPSGIQRTVSAIRAALPFVQRILPLLDGNIGAAVSNMLTPHHHAPLPPPPAPVNLVPLQESLADLQAQQKELHEQVLEQNGSLKRVEDQLEMVREATDRNTLEQQELLEDLKVVGGKVNLFALIALGLLVVSVIVNIFLYLQIRSLLR
jgi:hypothetical protein